VARQFFLTLIATASVSAALLAPGATAAPQQREPGVAGAPARRRAA